MRIKRILQLTMLSFLMPAMAMASCGDSKSNSKADSSSDSSTGSDSAIESVSESASPATSSAVADVVKSLDQIPGVKVVDNVIFSENIPVVVDFYATWCGPCKIYSPTFHAIAERYDGQAIFVSIDVDQYPELAKNYGIQSIPSTAFIQPGGALLGKEVGVLTEEQLNSYVLQLIETSAGESMSM